MKQILGTCVNVNNIVNSLIDITNEQQALIIIDNYSNWKKQSSILKSNIIVT